MYSNMVKRKSTLVGVIFLKRVKPKVIVVTFLLILVYILLTFYLETLRHRPTHPYSHGMNTTLMADDIESIRLTRNLSRFIRYPSRSYRYELSEILMVRIYKDDKAAWTVAELKQWIHFMMFAGVQHFYLCDHFVRTDERLDIHLQKYINQKIITYIPWPWSASYNGGDVMVHQVGCYFNVIHKFGDLSRWQMSIDMDEYPVCLNDTKTGFLRRFLDRQGMSESQLLMPNFLMLGQGDLTRDMIIERINRVSVRKANTLSKPLYRPFAVQKPDIHSHAMLYGRTTETDPAVLIMLHYWGRRLQNWGPDTDEVLNKTVVWTFMQGEISRAVRESLLEFDEVDAFSVGTGP